MNTGVERTGASRAAVIAAFAAVYVIWGSTYLGIRFAVETLPPFLMGGTRFLLAGTILYAWLRLSGTGAPSRRNWKRAAVAGALLLGVGNGGVNWAEQKVSSALAALIIAGTPMWFALFDWLRPGGRPPTAQTVIGIAVGFVGVLFLVSSNSGVGAGGDVLGVATLLVASAAWAIGSLYTKYSPEPEPPLMTAAQQMIMGGVIMLLVGAVTGEVGTFHWKAVSLRSINAFVYLTFVGSLVGFSAYAFLLKATTPARAATYAYVNPVIAMFLGWLLGGEHLSQRMMLAAVVIVAGVVIITTKRTAALIKDVAPVGVTGTAARNQ
jgi:drug/metabolite transporter (DMT)-like permease